MVTIFRMGAEAGSLLSMGFGTYSGISVHLSKLVFVESMEGKVPLLGSESYRRFKEVRWVFSELKESNFSQKWVKNYRFG